ncbi:cytochrome P450 71AU50-like [Nicotiana tomentosiformis]|uniref:cytochrome P450 71AU50-like n=1 Tax=Nicotiana tomentosiformis TaxID=4098 RepID=UPI00051BBBC2|nr:cytochrome P450 CYP736A12-like [Nicotiana tomentosiformis]
MAYIWATTLIVGLLVYAFYELLNIKKRKRFPPGPKGLPILGHLHLLAEKFLKTYDHIFAGRPHHEASQYLDYGQKNLTFAKYGAYWRNMRKLCTVHLLNSHKMNSFRSMRKQEVELLIESLKEQAHDCVAVDLSAKITSLNANLTCLMVFGNKYMDEDLDKRGFKAVVQDVVHLAGTPNLRDFFPFLVS